jgi:protein-disulfide isomerase
MDAPKFGIKMDERNGSIFRRFTDGLITNLFPDGRLSHWAFAGATVAAVIIAAILIFVGRMGYASTDFISLPPNSAFPAVAPVPALPAGTLAYGTSLGRPDAPVIIVTYSDFLCGHCQDFTLTTEKKLEKAYIDTGQVRLVYKYFVAFGDDSILVAEAAECAAEQNMFWPYHDLLMQKMLYPGNDISVNTLEDLASQVSLDMKSFDASLTSGKYREKVLADDAEARQLGIKGPPVFFINNMKGTGIKPFEAFQKVISGLIK